MNPSTRHTKPERLPDEAIELIAAELKVMAVPNRIRLMELLSQGDATVQELSDQLATTHQNVSSHLTVLYHAGFVSRKREGTSVRYSLIDWTGWWVVEQIGRSIEERLDARRRHLTARD